MTTKHDLLSIEPLMPEAMVRLDKIFKIHQLPLDKAQWEGLVKPIGAGIRFVQTTGFSGCPTNIMRMLPKLEIVSCMGVGVDAIDLAQARERGIAVTNTPDVLNDDVADLGIALMLMAARRLALSDRYVRDGRWKKLGNQALATKVSGKKLGIIGMGRIGKVIARRAAAFDMKISYHARNRQDVAYAYFPDLVAMARDVDFLIAIVPGGAATKGLVSAAVIEALGPKGIFINVSRGSVVDEPALVKALVEGRLGAAGLDVFADEPNVPDALLSLDNVALAPHVGSATQETRMAMANLVVDNLMAQLEGRKLLTRVV
jgi:lactate dehydrogenase-like 2-hydroxyacid dehydrogenase